MSDALMRGASSASLVVLGQAGKMVIQFLSIIVLSRMLRPEDFGLIAMVAAFVAFGDLVRDFGTVVVGLQRQRLTQQQASNLLWLSIALGIGAAILLVALTPLAVLLYDEPRLAAVMPVLAGTVLLNAATAQFQVQLARSMRFGRLVAADLAAQASGLAIAIVGAFSGWEYWALVAQVLAVALVGLVLRWWASGWLPSCPRRGAGNRAMVNDSLAFGASQVLTYVAANIDTVAIGARWDAASVGSYNRAFQILTAPLNSIIGPLTQVVIPTVNRAKEEGRTSDSVLLRLQFALGLPIVWIYGMSAAVANWFIPLVLGPNWDSAVTIFQILAVGGVVWTFSRVSYWGFVAANLGGQLVRYNLLTKTLAAILVLVASRHSIEAVAWAVSIGLVASWPINLVWLAKTAGQDSWRYWWNGILLAGACAFGFAAARATAPLTSDLPAAMSAVVSVVVGTLTYVSVIASVPSGRSELRRLFRNARRVIGR